MIMRVGLFVLSAIVSATPSFAQQVNNSAGSPDDIIVTGQRIADTEAALKACIARQCPPDQDMAATLVHAENLFVAGRYEDARGTLMSSLGRNKNEAKRYPVMVAGLYRANGRIALHLGEGESYRISTIGSIDALKAGLPGDDPRVIAQRAEIGDMFARVGRGEAAFATYAKVVREAHAHHLPQIEGPTRLRIANLKLQVAGDLPLSAPATRDAIKELDDLVADPDESMQPYRFVAKVMKARILARRGDNSLLDALVAELRSRKTTTPILIDSKPILLNEQPSITATSINADEPTSQSLTAQIPTAQFDDQWIDVTFWIQADGSVSDSGIIRQSGSASGPWRQNVLSSVKSRHYAPLALPVGDPGLLRVERYTYTAFINDEITGSRMRTRSSVPRIEVMDLTQEKRSPATPS